MCDEIELLDFIENDWERNKIKQDTKIIRKVLRDNTKPFDMPDNFFVRRYRLSKDLVRTWCNEIKCYLPRPHKSTDLEIDTKVLIALSFYATGSYQRPIGDIAAHSVAQQTVSSVIKEITKCLNAPYFRRKYIHFPRNAMERRATVSEFYRKFGIPGVLGCIDGTHVAIKRPVQNEERFYSRKHYHSLNVQLVCDSDMKIISVDASHGGATHDAFIWGHHPLKTHMENLHNIWFLGDSGYPLRKSMMTPILDAPAGSPEAYYTDVHVRTRNVIERTIGLLKARFRCLLAHRVLHYEPHTSALIVNACVILHNICINANIPMEDTMTSEEVVREAQLQLTNGNEAHSSSGNTRHRADLERGLQTRRQLIAHLWANRSN